MRELALIPVSEEAKQVILGSLLGDGGFEAAASPNRNFGFAFKHCMAQEAYARYKASLLGPLLSGISYPKSVGFGVERTQVRVRAIRHPFFTELSKSALVGGTKVVPEVVLSDINPLGLAVWYMDDGSVETHVQKSGEVSLYIRLATHSFSTHDIDHLIDMLRQRFGVHATRNAQTRASRPGNPYWYVKTTNKDAERFLDIVRPHMAGAGMDYKLPQVQVVLPEL